MKSLKIFFLLIGIGILGFVIIPPLDTYIANMEVDEVEYYPEKTYLHTNKSYYNTKDTIWFKSYLVNGITHKQTNKSNIVFVELISENDSIVYKEKLFVLSNSFGTSGDIIINPKWHSGIYQLRAYTNYMRNQGEAYFF